MGDLLCHSHQRRGNLDCQTTSSVYHSFVCLFVDLLRRLYSSYTFISYCPRLSPLDEPVLFK